MLTNHLHTSTSRFAITFLVLGIPMISCAEEITPVGVRATSEFGAIDVFGDGNESTVFATKLIDGSGLEDFEGTPENILDDYHDNDPSSSNAWHSGDTDAGIPGGTDDDGDPFTPPLVNEQVVEFDLGGLFKLSRVHVWQQNQSNIFGESFSFTRGVEDFQILVSSTSEGDDFSLVGGFNLDFEEGLEPVPAQILELVAEPDARRVRFQLETAYSGLASEFVGLSEVRFEGVSNNTPGDFNGDGELSTFDLNALTDEVRKMTNAIEFDLNADSLVNQDDRAVWVEDLRSTYFGDANLDGEFNSTDFVTVFIAGEYEDGVEGNSVWETGDWDGDGDFNTTDFVLAFQSGGYEVGPRGDAAQMIPEPSSSLLVLLGVFTLVQCCRRGRQDGI